MTYKVQIDDLVRDATAEETAEIEANLKRELDEQKIAVERAEAKAALCARLGITAEEAALLLS